MLAETITPPAKECKKAISLSFNDLTKNTVLAPKDVRAKHIKEKIKAYIIIDISKSYYFFSLKNVILTTSNRLIFSFYLLVL